MSKVPFRSRLSPQRHSILPRGEDSRTQQHMRDECDINKILAKYHRTGVITHVNRAKERFGDFGQYGGLAEKLDVLAKAEQAFAMLPATIRNAVGNDIGSFLRYIEDPRHFDECVSWGIYDPPPKAPDVVTPPQPEVASDSTESVETKTKSKSK